MKILSAVSCTTCWAVSYSQSGLGGRPGWLIMCYSPGSSYSYMTSWSNADLVRGPLHTYYAALASTTSPCGVIHSVRLAVDKLIKGKAAGQHSSPPGWRLTRSKSMFSCHWYQLSALHRQQMRKRLGASFQPRLRNMTMRRNYQIWHPDHADAGPGPSTVHMFNIVQSSLSS